MKTKKKSPARKQQGNPKSNFNNNSLSSQRKRLLDRLRKSPVSTIEAREELNILMPAARIFELRNHQGLNIVTHWVNRNTAQGRFHRVAQYVLLPGKYKAAKHSNQ